MIDKIKKLKSKRDALVERLNRLNSEKKEALARVLEAEDKGKNSDDLRHDLHGFAAEIEVAEGAINRIDEKLKSQIADLVKMQLKSLAKERAQLLEEIKTTYLTGGKFLGRATMRLKDWDQRGPAWPLKFYQS